MQRAVRPDQRRVVPCRLALRALLIVAVTLFGAPLVGLSAASAGTARTIVHVVRPVTSIGQAAAGFTVQSSPGYVTCNTANPSPGAVDPNIAVCTPSAAYAIACWKAAAAGRVLCLLDPTKPVVSSIPLRPSTFSPTPRPSFARSAPLLLKLDNGVTCRIRDGGAWNTLASHPGWVGMYGCDNSTAVWAPPTAEHLGVNESAPSWTVQVAAMTGTGSLVTRHVTDAFFVGTAAGSSTLPFTGPAQSPRLAILVSGLLLLVGTSTLLAGRKRRTTHVRCRVRHDGRSE